MLLDYQKAWLQNPSRFKIGLWARQTGKSFTVSLEAALDAAFNTGTDWVFLSRGERQSKELMRKAKMHLKAITEATSDLMETEVAFGNVTYKQLEIVVEHDLGGESRIIGLPANPDTARGHSANLVLDEFAFHADSHEIWKALFPTVTRGYKLRVISTPQGKSNKFYEIWTGDSVFSKFRVDIYDAYKAGLPIYDDKGELTTPEFLREAIGDDLAWRQEYLLEFLDSVHNWIPFELISAAEDASIGLENPLKGEKNPLFMGIDIARKRHLTVIWTLEKVGDVHWTQEITSLHDTPFSEQREEMVRQIFQKKPQRVCIDGSGLGMQLAEELRANFGSIVEVVTFTLQAKEHMAVYAKRIFEDRRLRIPVDRRIRDDIHSLKRYITAAGNARFDAPKSDEGHADYFWALALALHAAETASSMPRILTAKRREATTLLKGY